MRFKMIIILIGIVIAFCISCKNQVVEKGNRLELAFKIYNSDSIILDESFFHNDFYNINDDELFSFRVGKNEVIKGWDSVIIGCSKDKVYTFNIPYNSAYGDENIYHDIPSKSNLIIRFIILSIQ